MRRRRRCLPHELVRAKKYPTGFLLPSICPSRDLTIDRLILLCGFLVCWILLAGCHDMRPAPSANHTSAVIVIPGYYGTELVERATGRLVWISVREALFGNTSLTLPLKDLGFETPVALQPASILRDIPIVPFVYAIDAYGPLMTDLKKSLGPNVRIEPMPYDWRQDLMQTVKELHGRVKRLQADGIKRIALLAHSMGGLAAAYYLRFGAQTLEGAVENWEGRSQVVAVILAGVPYRGSMSVFRNMQFGRPIGLNEEILTAEAFASFPSSYYVLPAPGSDVLWSQSTERFEGLLYQPDRWREYGWGLLRDRTTIPELFQNRVAYTTHWLNQARQFYGRVHETAQHVSGSPVPLMTVTGTGEDTLAAAFWLEAAPSVGNSLLFDQQHIDDLHLDLKRSLLLSEGDGTVTVPSATLPAAYRAAFVVQERTMPASHGELVTKSSLLREMARFLEAALASR